MAKSLLEEYIIRLTGEEDPSAKQVIKSLMTGRQAAEQTNNTFKELTKAVGNFSQTVGSLSSNAGFNSLVDFLTSDSFKRMTAVAALGAVTTAIYKFAASATKAELELQKTAKTQKKSVEALRAQNEALNAMGMTLKEVKKDKTLKGIYEDIKKTNEAMALPNLTNSIATVNGLRGAFWKLRSTVSYAVQWINAKYLANMNDILGEITHKLNDVQGWVQTNMGRITDVAATLLTDVSKGVYTIFEGFENIGKLVNALPDGVKILLGSIAGLYGVIQSGPIGQLLAFITMIGDIRHDYENWQHQKAGDEGYENLKTAGWLWEVVDADDMTISEKTTEILNRIFGKLGEGLQNWADNLENTNGLEGVLTGESGVIGKILTSIGNWIQSENGKNLISDTLGSAFNLAMQATTLVGDVAGDIAGLIARALGSDDLADKLSKDNSIVNGLLGSVVSSRIITLITGSDKAGFIGGIVTGLMSLFGSARKEALRKIAKEKHGLTDAEIGMRGDAWLDKNYGNDPELLEYMMGGVGEDAVNTITTLFNDVIVRGIELVGTGAGVIGDIAAKFAGKVIGILCAPEIEQQLNEQGGQGTLLDEALGGFLTGSLIRAITGSNEAGIIGGVVTSLADLYTEARHKALKQLSGYKGEGEPDYEQLEKDYGQGPKIWEMILEDVAGQSIGTIQLLWEGICKAVVVGSGIGGSLLSTLVSSIITAMTGGKENATADDVKKNVLNQLDGLGSNTIFEGFALGLAGWLATGNFAGGLITGIGSTIIKAIDDAQNNKTDLYTELKTQFDTFVDKISTMWLGIVDEDGNRLEETGLRSVVNKLLWGDDKTDYGSDIIAVIDETRNDVIKRQKKGGLLNWLLGYDADITRGDTKIGTEHVKGAFETAFEAIVGKLEEANGFLSQLWAPIKNWLEDIVIQGIVNEFSEGGKFASLFSEGGTIATLLSNFWNNTLKPMIDGWLGDVQEAIYGVLPEELRVFFKDPTKSKMTKDEESGLYNFSVGDEDVTVGSEVGAILENAGATLAREKVVLGTKPQEGGFQLPGFDEIKGAKKYDLMYGINSKKALNALTTALTAAAMGGDANLLNMLISGYQSSYDSWKNDGLTTDELIDNINQIAQQQPIKHVPTDTYNTYDGWSWEVTPDGLIPENGRNGASKLPKGAFIIGGGAGMSDRGRNYGFGLSDEERSYYRDGVSYNPGIADNVILSKLYNTDNDAGNNVIATVEQLKLFQQAISDTATKLVSDSDTLSDRVNILRDRLDDASVYLADFSGEVDYAISVVFDFGEEVVTETGLMETYGKMVVTVQGQLEALGKAFDTTVTDSITPFQTAIGVTVTALSETLVGAVGTAKDALATTLKEAADSAAKSLGSEGVSGKADDASTKLGLLSTAAGNEGAAGKLSTLSDKANDASGKLTQLGKDAGSASSALGSKGLSKTAGDASSKLSDLQGAAGTLAGTFSNFKMPKIDTSGLTGAISNVKNGLNSLYDALSLKARQISEISVKTGGNAMGARVDHEIVSRVGEDGTEYIIPITKPHRAFPLINQMLTEMGTDAVERIVKDFGLGSAGTIGYSAASMQSAAQNLSQSNTYNISAPVTITVNGTGNAEDIGSAAYDAAERHLLRTLKGVYA